MAVIITNMKTKCTILKVECYWEGDVKITWLSASSCHVFYWQFLGLSDLGLFLFLFLFFLESLGGMCAFQISGYWWLQIYWKEEGIICCAGEWDGEVDWEWSDCLLNHHKIVCLNRAAGHFIWPYIMIIYQLSQYFCGKLYRLFYFRFHINIFILKKYSYLSDDKFSLVLIVIIELPSLCQVSSFKMMKSVD